MFGISVTALRTANPWIGGDLIGVGDVLSVPGSSEAISADLRATPPASVAEAVTLLALVDKQHSLPSGYVPPDLVGLSAQWAVPGGGTQYLRSEADAALTEMLQAAREAGFDIRVSSS